MAKTRPSVQKRRLDATKIEKAQIKAARKAARDAEKEDREAIPDGIDPDLMGIVPGPQPVMVDDW